MIDIDRLFAVLQDQLGLLITLVLVPLVLVVILNRRPLVAAWLNLKTRYRLNRLGLKQIADFKFPDGLGNYFTVDRMIMRPDGISLVVFKQFPGSIFCADDIEEWTQMLAGKSYRFKNPLIDLDYQIKAVSAVVPNVPVDGYLFFDHQALFPKGHPERVISLQEIPEALEKRKKSEASAGVTTAWDKLKAISGSL